VRKSSVAGFVSGFERCREPKKRSSPRSPVASDVVLTGAGIQCRDVKHVVAPPRVSLGEAAEQLGVHYMTAYRYVRTGRLPAEIRGARWTVAVTDLHSLVPARRETERGDTTLRRQTQLRDRMTKGDDAGAWRVIEDAMASGFEPNSIHTQLLLPSLQIIGEEWEAGRRTVAEEHRASEIAGRIIGRLGPRFTRRGPSRGTIVLGVVPGDPHGLGAGVLSDFLRHAGFEPVNLGANTPVASFVEMALHSDRVLAVMVGATTLRRDKVLREVAGALRKVGITRPILAGGRAVRDEAHARALGADGWSGHSAEDAVARVSALLSTKSALAVSRSTNL
jgi:excisionase family DNA binding protein